MLYLSSMLLTKLLFVHFTADYILQTDLLVKGKEKFGLRSWHVWLHVCMHGLLVHLVVQSWLITGVTLVSHAVIDALKVSVKEPNKTRIWFFIDQLLHLLVVAALVLLVAEPAESWLPVWFESNLVLLTAVVILTKPAKYLIGIFISCWVPSGSSDGRAIRGNGAYVGVSERLLIFTLIVIGMWPIALLLMAGKLSFYLVTKKGLESRFELKYNLLGSLLSFSVATLCALWLLASSG